MSHEIDYQSSSSQRQLCMLVLDASGSMGEPVAGSGKTRIQMLNDGLKAFKDDLMKDEVARNKVRISIVLVGGPQDDAALLMDWTDVIDYEPFEVSAGGLTPLAKGLRIGLQVIEQEKLSLKSAGITYTRPWMFVMTDGAPTDTPTEWQTATAECHQYERDRRCSIFPIGVDDADMNVLAQVSSTTPPALMSAAKFREFFVWLSASTRIASASAPGSTVQLPTTNGWAFVPS
jgi:uncharacterized protein YegL